MQLSIENLGSSQLLHNESESEELGPSCLRPLYKGQSGDEHLVVGPIYHRPQRKGEYDHLLFQDSLAQSERFINLKPEVVFSILGERRKYAYLKKFAIQRLQDNIREQLEILYNLEKCKNLYQEPEELQTHSVFSWFMEDFFKRRDLKTFIWLDILQRTSAVCLNIFKFKQDIEQLQKFLQLIFEGLFSNMDEEEIDVYQHIVKTLNDAKKLLNISQHIELDLKSNRRLLNELLLKDSILSNIKQDSVHEMMKIYLETKILNRHIWGPIEVRYQLKWHDSKVQQFRYRLEKMEESRQLDIDQYQIKTFNEKRVSTSCMDFYYSNLESLKTRLNQMQDKFEVDHEDSENRIAYKRARNEKLRDQRKFLGEEILRFHTEIEQMHEREEQEAAVRERRKREKEALDLKKSRRKVKKRIKKTGGDNKAQNTVKSKGLRKIISTK